MSKKKSTSWGKVASWYDKHLANATGTYHKKVILPNLMRLMSVKRGETVLDVACGQGFFSREMHHAGAKVMGVDIAKPLIKIAKEQGPADIEYVHANAEDLTFIKQGSIDKALIVLAIQNIKGADTVFQQVSRVLKPGGKMYIVMNHPCYRIPKQSKWAWEEGRMPRLRPGQFRGNGRANRPGPVTQYRRIDTYMTPFRSEIDMHPGQEKSETTVTFHRPLQAYFDWLHQSGFAVSRLEEWISHKESTEGRRAKAENTARLEIPLFMCLEATKQ